LQPAAFKAKSRWLQQFIASSLWASKSFTYNPQLINLNSYTSRQ